MSHGLHIVTGSDDNYAAGVAVLIASAAAHNPGLRVTILDQGIRPENRARLDALGPTLGVSVERIEVSPEAFASLPVMRSHLTASTYLRLLIPELMPDEDRVVYMDCDMVVTDDLSPLAGIDLGDAIIAAVPCPSPHHLELRQLGIPDGEYVNAGLLVMNLPVWRRENVAESCLRLLADPDNPLMSEDQSAVNIVARGRISFLPARYNVYSDPAAWDDVARLPADPAVIHYVVGMKPWAAKVPLGDIWWRSARQIGALLPPSSTAGWRKRISAFNRQRKMIVGLVTGRAKYRNRWRVMRRMSEITRRLTRDNASPSL